MRQPWVRWALRLVTLAALGYVAHAVWTNLSGLAAQDLPAPALIAAALAVPVYGGALFLLAESWHRILAAMGGAVPRRQSMPAFTDTQLAKYLPGNVLHVVSRHVRLAGAGVPHRVLALAFAAETAVLAGGALILAVGVLALAPPGAGWPAGVWAGWGVPAQAGVAVLVLAGLGLGLWRGGLAVLPALVLAVAFFALSGGIFLGLAQMLVPGAGAELAGLAVIAWLVGFVTPGAPGGLGPREAALLALTAPALGEPAALVAIALYRGVTLAGDLVCFVLGRALFGDARPPR